MTNLSSKRPTSLRSPFIHAIEGQHQISYFLGYFLGTITQELHRKFLVFLGIRGRVYSSIKCNILTPYHGRMPSRKNPETSRFYDIGVIHLQRFYCGASTGCHANHQGAIRTPLHVCVPGLHTRIEERYDCASHRVGYLSPIALEFVASMAR